MSLICVFLLACSSLFSSEMAPSQMERVFSDIYTHHVWGKDAQGFGTSGSGSTLREGVPFIQYIQHFLDTHDIASIVDLGCGDFVLGKEIDWQRRLYTGVDVVRQVVERNKVLYETETISFLPLDIVGEELPPADLLICKDVLMHLPIHAIVQVLEKMKQYKYCILVNDFENSRYRQSNIEIPLGGYRPLRLKEPPFGLFPREELVYRSGHVTKQILLISHRESLLAK